MPCSAEAMLAFNFSLRKEMDSLICCKWIDRYAGFQFDGHDMTSLRWSARERGKHRANAA